MFSCLANTKVHSYASSPEAAGISSNYSQTINYNPATDYTRQTNPCAQKHHLYELETLAVVKYLKQVRVHLIDIDAVVVTDCIARKATNKKKCFLPRWWRQLQEYYFTVEYRPNADMKHIDTLSRNTVSNKNNLQKKFFLYNSSRLSPCSTINK